jgi:hypothetical protein
MGSGENICHERKKGIEREATNIANRKRFFHEVSKKSA